MIFIIKIKNKIEKINSEFINIKHFLFFIYKEIFTSSFKSFQLLILLLHLINKRIYYY